MNKSESARYAQHEKPRILFAAADPERWKKVTEALQADCRITLSDPSEAVSPAQALQKQSYDVWMVEASVFAGLSSNDSASERLRAAVSGKVLFLLAEREDTLSEELTDILQPEDYFLPSTPVYFVKKRVAQGLSAKLSGGSGKEVRATEIQMRHWQRLASTDGMTGLVNRRYCMACMEEYLAEGAGFIFCFLDADRLKAVNDQYGHVNGDRYILAIAEALRACCPEEAVISRFYGDEFAVLLRDGTPDQMQQILAQVAQRLSEKSREVPFSMSVSHGLYLAVPGKQLSVKEILYAADMEMYRNKKGKKQ